MRSHRGLPVEGISNPRIQAEWTSSETDAFLNAYLRGQGILELARVSKRTPKGIYRKMQHFAYNTDDALRDYTPRKGRETREGAPWTTNEKELLRCHREWGFPSTWSSSLLQRSVMEVEEKKLSGCKVPSTTFQLDLLMAHRYLFHVRKTPVIANELYDKKKQKVLSKDPMAATYWFSRGATDMKMGYPPGIRDLAFYLVAKKRPEALFPKVPDASARP